MKASLHSYYMTDLHMQTAIFIWDMQWTKFQRISSFVPSRWWALELLTFPAGILTAFRSNNNWKKQRWSQDAYSRRFSRKCREYALKQVEGQKKDFKRLGIAGEWDNPYLTLHPEFEAAQIRVFGKMAEKGLIYKGLRPVYWSWSSESALAEAEVEYHDVVSPSAFYGVQVKDGKEFLIRIRTLSYGRLLLGLFRLLKA